MKTINFLAIIAILALFSCHQQVDSGAIKVDFGIYVPEQTVDYDFYDLNKMNKVIGLDEIRKTKVDGQDVMIYFNMDGAKKWADITKNNIGKTLVFAINGEIIYTPMIATELRNGVAKITGLNDEASAINLSKSLNASTSK